MLSPGPDVTLSDILITSALALRDNRAPNLTSENSALHRMARMSTQPVSVIFNELLEIALDLCEAETAGVSLLERVPGEPERFRWVAVSGKLANAAGGWIPREASPCGVTLARSEPQLFDRPGRLFTAYADANVLEGLVIPISFEDQHFGTIWVVTHSRSGTFDLEDVRIMTSLAAFCAMACLLSRAHGGQGRYQIPFLRSLV